MRTIALIITLSLLAGCNENEISYISIRNQTSMAIYALPYTCAYSDGEWIQPGVTDEFYSINIDNLNGYEYFSVFYDSLIIFVKDHEEYPIKFYKDGTSVNYDETLNPFINPDVWSTRAFHRHLKGSSFESLEEKQIYEDYFSIDPSRIIYLGDQ